MPPTPNQITIKNAVLIIVVMLLGLYIALGAIFSLSYIKDLPADKDAVVARFDSSFRSPLERFEKEFKNINTNPEEISNITAVVNDLKIFKTLDIVLASPAASRNKIEILIDELTDTLTPHVNNLSLQGELLFKQYQDLNTQLNTIYETGNAKFQNSIKRLSAGLLTKYCEDLITFLGEYQANASTVLHHNLSDFRRNSISVDRLVRNSKTNLEILRTKIANHDTVINIPITSGLNTNFLPRTSSYLVKDLDSAGLAAQIIPKEGAIGQDWGGIFSWMISPIARSKNVDVLLICGMIGFGLFGAAIAIFIIGKDLQKDTAGSNLLLVIVRGFSAAIVVYLAARAGIAVVNNGTSDPNPLVLFLFCFTGAVFSERIWAWAKLKISDSFPDQPREPK